MKRNAFIATAILFAGLCTYVVAGPSIGDEHATILCAIIDSITGVKVNGKTVIDSTGKFVGSGGIGTITLPATVGGTVNSGGIPYFSSATQMSSSAALAANGVVVGGGAGTTPATIAAGTNGQILAGVTSASPAMVTLSQDCTITNAGVITCTKTNNVAFAPSATTDTTTAANISAGTLALARGGTGLSQVASQQVTTAGTQVNAGVTQAQTGVTITGLTTTSACMASVPTSLPATWQTGIAMQVVVTSNTATLELTNPTAGNITPAAQAVNLKCIL